MSTQQKTLAITGIIALVVVGCLIWTLGDLWDLDHQMNALQGDIHHLSSQYKKLGLSKDLLVLQKDRIALKSTVTNGIVQTVGGGILLSTAFISWQNLQETKKNVLAVQKNVEVAEKKQVTERFTQAIGQLGETDKTEICLGGIYALEQIAKDSETYHWTVMEVLTAFIRERSPLPFLLDPPETGVYFPIKKPIQAALTVIGRRMNSYAEDGRINLMCTNLRGADMQSSMMNGVDLQHSYLIGASFKKAHLKGANLSNTFLWSTPFNKADLREANFSKADLCEADLSGADLSNADFSGAKLNGANLDGANLTGANLSGAEELDPDRIKRALNWETAHYDKNFRQTLGLPPEPEEIA